MIDPQGDAGSLFIHPSSQQIATESDSLPDTGLSASGQSNPSGPHLLIC